MKPKILRKLDRDRPYGEVQGLPGAAFVQDGICFNPGGFEVDASKLEHVDDEPAKPSPRDDTPIYPATVMGSPPRVLEDAPLESKHWMHLKAMVEAYGGTWTNEKDAVDFLRGKHV